MVVLARSEDEALEMVAIGFEPDADDLAAWARARGWKATAIEPPAVTMTPLHELLIRALDRAQQARPDLTLADIARVAGLEKGNLYRARRSCSEETLGRVLAAIAELTGERLDVGLVAETGPPLTAR